MKSKALWADITVLVVVPIWALDYVVTKVVLRELDPLVYASLRFFIASSLLMIVRRNFATSVYSSRELLKIIAAGVIGVSVYQACYTKGLQFISASEASLLIATSPIFTAFIAAGLGSERLIAKQLIGAVLALVGVGFVVSGGLSNLQFQSSAIIGYTLMLITAASFGFRSVILQPVLENHPAIPTVTRSILAGTSVLLVISLFSIFSQDWSTVTYIGWLAVGYGAIFSTAIGYVLWYRGIGQIGATRTMLYYYLVPLIAVLLAVLFLNEKLTISFAIGGLFIFVGVTLAKWKVSGSEKASQEKQEVTCDHLHSRL